MALKTEQPHFLIVPFLSQSHIIPLIDFAKLLAQHGVFVSIATTPINAVKHKGVIDHARAHDLKIQTITVELPCNEEETELCQASQLLQGPLEKVMQELDPKPNCVVSTSSVTWIHKFAEKFKIPMYCFETISCFTQFCSGKVSQAKMQASVLSDSDPFPVPDIPHKIEFTKAQMPKSLREDSGGDFRAHLEQIMEAKNAARGILVNSLQELEPWYLEAYRKGRDCKVWCVGPVSLCNRGNKAASTDEHYCLTWLNEMKPKSVIYACFGSLCRISAPQIKEMGLGLEASNSPFIWVISKRDFSPEVESWLAEERFDERVKGRGLVVRGWAPQVPILSHPSVGGFLTHCGWNSTLEAICAGLPMITWPMMAEQFYNDKFIVDVLGIGVRVGVECCMDYEKSGGYLVKSHQVKNAVEKLMDGSEEGIERRKKVEELAKTADNAVKEGGSSYSKVVMLIEDVMEQVANQI